MTWTPPHAVCEPDKLAAMVAVYRNGGTLPPIVVSGEQAVTGSHRIRAWEIAHEAWNLMKDGWDTSEPTLETVEIEDQQLARAMVIAGSDSEWCDIYEALLAITEDSEVKAALADQIR